MKQQGIAIVSALIILMVIMALGASSLFLTNMNLKTAENARSSTVAKGNAETGLDAAFVLLKDSYQSTDQFSAQANNTYLSSSTYTVTYAPITPSAGQPITQVKVTSLGQSASGGQYLSEAIIQATSGAPIIPPVYMQGLVSEGQVRVNGGASLFIDAAVHGNQGFWLGGDFEVCDTRDAAGFCTDFNNARLADPDLPVSMSNPAGTCRVRNTNCNPTNYQAPAVDVNPNYLGRRNKAGGLTDRNGDGVIAIPADCPVGYISAFATPIAVGAKICTNLPVALNNPNLNGVTIIAPSITATGNVTLNNTTLISMTGTVNIDSGAGTANLTNSRIFSQASLGSQTKEFTWNGQNTVATAGNITFNGANKHNNTVNMIANSDGSESIGLVLIAEGNITFNGRNNASRTYAAAFVAGGTLTQNGRSDFFGTISAQQNLTFNGNLTIDSGLPIVNSDLEEEGTPIFAFSSRR